MVLLLILSTFTFQHFQHSGGGLQGYLYMPSTPPKALILYFHRYVEKGDAVKNWGEGLTPRGYAVAGYTASSGGNAEQMANHAIIELHKKPELARIPFIAVGASMGAESAARWFASNSQVRALVMIVPGAPGICDYLKSSGGRPIFLIQAENDEVSYGSGAKIRECTPAAKKMMLKGASHIFPPSAVAKDIADWLDSLPLSSAR
jgi:hypothetical protein